MVENTGGIDGLESQVLVVKVTDEQTLGGKGIGLNVDIGASDAAQETGLSDVGVSADEESSGVGVDGGKTTQMLSNLVKVEEGVLETLAEGGHATEGGPLQLLALEERLTVLEETDVVARNGLHQMLRSRQLTQGDSEMVGIVKSVEQVLVEGMDILQSRETLKNGAELLREGLLGELDLSSVESCEREKKKIKLA